MLELPRRADRLSKSRIIQQLMLFTKYYQRSEEGSQGESGRPEGTRRDSNVFRCHEIKSCSEL